MFGLLDRATAKNRVSGDWNLFNDERVHGLEPNEVQSASAYVLFYTKVGHIVASFFVAQPKCSSKHHWSNRSGYNGLFVHGQATGTFPSIFRGEQGGEISFMTCRNETKEIPVEPLGTKKKKGSILIICFIQGNPRRSFYSQSLD